MVRSVMRILGFAVATAALGIPTNLMGQDRRDEQFYYPGSFNWVFLRDYPEAAKLFNAFDYGHATLYERLYSKPGRAGDALEKDFEFLTTDLLINPPRFAIAEEAIEPSYAKIAWKAKQMFDWAHILHRQIYDIYADRRLGKQTRDSLIERVTDYYLSRTDYAFVPVPKSMALMDEQYFSQSFRRAYPKFNGLIWAYHWLQVGLYEPLIGVETAVEKKSGVKATLARFWSMLESPPRNFPRTMPMTSVIAPTFTSEHPRAAAIFDNLHMMHDIISDILVSDSVPRARKREVIYRQLAEFRDSTKNTMTADEWRGMGDMMGGIVAMGGPATGLLTSTKDQPSGAGEMDHVKMRHPVPMAGAPHADTARKARQESSPASGGEPGMVLLELFQKMMSDSTIRARVLADSSARRMWLEVIELMPEEHREHVRMRLTPAAPAGAAAKRERPTNRGRR